MATSILTGGGLVEFAASLYGTDDDPMDAVMMRDGVMHGLLHAADSMAQVRVNYLPIASAAAEGQDSFETTEPPANTTDYLLLGGSPFGPWPLTVRANGQPYKLRVRIAGAVSATPATATFRVILAAAGARLSETDILEALDSTFEAEATSTTAAWLSGSSQGSLANSTLITVSTDQVRSWTRNVPIFNAVSSPSAGQTIRQVGVKVYVFAKTTNTSRLAQLHALHIQEYIGT